MNNWMFLIGTVITAVDFGMWLENSMAGVFMFMLLGMLDDIASKNKPTVIVRLEEEE